MQDSLHAKYNQSQERRAERSAFIRTHMPVEDDLIIYLHILGVKNIYVDFEDEEKRKELLSKVIPFQN
jgi:hypothetical protein